ncbi:hypothetical protein FRB99_004179, partial [Tulasnella sp. 403]
MAHPPSIVVDHSIQNNAPPVATAQAQLNSLTVGNNILDDSDAPEADAIQDPENIVLEAKAFAHGGRANVYKATWTRSGGQVHVAVKVLRLNGISRSVEYAERLARVDLRLSREMFVWKDLEHPRITPFLGYMKSKNRLILDDSPILVSPYYANGNLVTYLSTNPDADVFALLEQAGEGLLYLHTRTPQIAHLDIKGENILVTDLHEASICDFGVARVLDDTLTGFFATSNPVFTLTFAAPEVLDGDVRPGTAADVYSFAGLILQVLSGKPPYWEIISKTKILTN